MNKRKRESDSEVAETEPAPVVEGASGGEECDSATRAKRVALRRLFGRCSEPEETTRAREHLREELEAEEEPRAFLDENEDPLLDTVPVNMDPEQLGFLVCAQETLRFLHRRGLSIRHPVFSRLRSRFLRGLNEMANA